MHSRAAVFRPINILVNSRAQISHPALKPSGQSGDQQFNAFIYNRRVPVNLHYAEYTIGDCSDVVLRKDGKTAYIFGKINVSILDDSPQIFLRRCILEALYSRGYFCSYTDVDLDSDSETQKTMEFLNEITSVVT